MRRASIFAISILLSSGLVFAQGPPATAPATQPSPPAIEAINQATDPSSAVEAYARGIAAKPGDVELQQAYVHHMVDLGAPELADAQAHNLVQHKAADALTMGVAAYMDASRGQ